MIDVTNFEKVGDFMEACDQEILDEPQFPDGEVVHLRTALIQEEFDELLEGIESRDIVEVADALTDLLYVIYGAGHAFGIDLDACFEEVHESNMSKLVNGYAQKNEMGKVMKGPDYFEPNLEGVLGL
jgi:predicted HAD superfamily Cof-like phosphohydrolase